MPEVNNLKSTGRFIHKLVIRYNEVKQDSWPMPTSEMVICSLVNKNVKGMRNQITRHFAELNLWCETIN